MPIHKQNVGTIKFDELVKSRKLITPAKAGVHNLLESLDSRLRGNDRNGAKRTFWEAIKFPIQKRMILYKFKEIKEL